LLIDVVQIVLCRQSGKLAVKIKTIPDPITFDEFRPLNLLVLDDSFNRLEDRGRVEKYA
jgi:hypothetical protein